MAPTIHLAFVDDWELRGNGSGDVREMQFKPLRELVGIYNKYGIRGSFNAEVLQQLTFRANQDRYPELGVLADEWEESIRYAYSNGHDVQLHIHPQWKNAKYDGEKWELVSDWSILNYPAGEALEMLQAGKEYLEGLLKEIDPDYRCLSFRSGSWCIAPSPHMLELLVDLGVVFDMSIVGGVKLDTRRIKLDYTECEEDFLPYYPEMSDARKVSKKKEPIVCVPTNCFYASRKLVFRQQLARARRKFVKVAPQSTGQSVGSYSAEWEPSGDSRLQRVIDEKLVPYIKGQHYISDLAQLNADLMGEMLASIRRRALKSGYADVPVILENHTKDVKDFSPIESFVKEVSEALDIKFLTLTELAKGLQNGKFKVKKSSF
jgi:hypothetical protein